MKNIHINQSLSLRFEACDLFFSSILPSPPPLLAVNIISTPDTLFHVPCQQDNWGSNSSN